MSDFGKPSEKEEEFFARREFERRKQQAQERALKQAEADVQSLKDLHWMRCPKCGHELVEVAHREVRIDRCSACDGMWLDAGELDLLLKDGEARLPLLRRLFGN